MSALRPPITGAEMREQVTTRRINKPTTTDEYWLPIPGYEGFYSVSSTGRVRTEPRTVTLKTGRTMPVKARILRCGPTGKGGYPRFNAGVNGKSKVLFVHQCVMLAFVGPPPSGHEVIHYDGDPVNNRLDNLLYGTRAQTIDNAKRRGTFPRYEDRPGAVLTREQARIIAGSSKKADFLANRFGVKRGTIQQIRQGLTWTDLTADVRKSRYRMRGENAPWSKLSESEVLQIYQSPKPHRWLAKCFGVNRRMVWAIKKGRAWRHVTGHFAPSDSRPHRRLKLL
jgi:HNH endonuclease/NUMOD4 motif